MVALSIVVPVYNEEDNVPLLGAAVAAALDDTIPDYELVLVDDGSSDETFARASALVDRDARVRVVKFRRNFGQTAAMAAGIQAARGDIIVTMDGDLQNDPTDIPRMVELLRSGYDLVIGWRKKRKDEGPRVFVSRVANRIMARVMGVAVKDSGCSLKAFRASLIQGIPIYGEMHRFIPALSQLAGARLMEIEVKHHPRRFGVSKYGFARIYRVMLDIVSIRFLLSYVRRPLAWHATFTAATFVVGAVIVLWSLAFGPGIFATGNSLVEVSAGLLLLSLSLFLTAWGIVGQLFAFMEPSVLRFASMGSALSAKASPSTDTVP